jgi:23S rRNA pseudouridine1911/1915/1917 synthase
MTEQGRGTIDAPLGRDQNNRLKQAVRKDGREAITHFAVEARYGGEGWDITRVRCELETGRTHQIRVHMAHIGAPVLGDQTYGKHRWLKADGKGPAYERATATAKAFERQALHAAILGFEHPVTKKALRFERPPPADMQDLIAALKGLPA